MPRRLKGFLKKATLACVATLLGFAVLEGGYRVYNALARRPGQEALFEPDPVLGRRHVKNASVVVSEWCKPAPNRVSINSFGFRGPNPRTLEKPPGVIRVICSGGSTTEDIFVDDGRTWPEQLQEKLNARLHTDRIEVINMGTSGYTAANCLKDLELNGLALKPDVVIAYHGVNDFRKNLVDLRGLEPMEAYVKYEEREKTWLARLLCRSLVIDRVNQAWYYQGGARSRAHTLAYWSDPDSRAVDVEGVEGPTLRALEGLRELSAKHHFKVVVGRQATLMKPTLTEEEVTHMWRVFRWKYEGRPIKWQSFYDARSRVVDAQQEFARRHGLPYIDTESRVPKTGEYFVDDAHTLENGADRISDAFAEGLANAGVFDEWLGKP
jgi:hypothetical protein